MPFNLTKDILGVIQDSVISKSQYFDTLADHVRIACLVVVPLRICIVHATITLNHDSSFAAEEI